MDRIEITSTEIFKGEFSPPPAAYINSEAAKRFLEDRYPASFKEPIAFLNRRIEQGRQGITHIQASLARLNEDIKRMLSSVSDKISARSAAEASKVSILENPTALKPDLITKDSLSIKAINQAA